jgi:ATP-dependent Zn protease
MNNQNISSSETPVCNSLKPLALAAVGRTGADIERLIREARQKARRAKQKLTYDDIMDALTAERSLMGPELLWQIAVHESGHALVISLLEIANIQTVSVGNGQGGFVDSLTKTGMVENEDWLQKLIAFLLAGRAAEKLIFGDTGIGSGGTSASDLARATKLATDAETLFGLGQHLPLLYRSVNDSPSILSLDKQLASDVHKRLVQAELIASELLSKNKGQLLLLARHLADAKVLDGNEVRQFLDQPILDQLVEPAT